MAGLQKSVTLSLDSETATTALGHHLAKHLQNGDTLLLDGPIGAGKTHLARSIIQALLPHDEDVPSPTYTLVQTYETPSGTIWHADLYRLADSSELIELGLDEAMGTGIVVIEWPDRIPEEMRPPQALWIILRSKGERRNAELFGNITRWAGLFSELSHE